jgi:3-oxoadipate enol-lactonase
MTPRVATTFSVPLRERIVVSPDGTELAVQEAGPEDGDLILVVNGPGADYRAWKDFFEEFSDTYRIVTWDLRGFFHSRAASNAPSRLGPEAHAEDVWAILQDCGRSEAIFVGWSLGVQILLETYRQHADAFRALIAVNGSYGRPFERSQNLRGASALQRITDWLPEEPEIMSEGIRFLETHPSLLQAAKALHLVSPVLNVDRFMEIAVAFRSVNLAVYRQTLQAFAVHDAESVLAVIRCPTLFFCGRRDPLMPARYSETMARRVLRSELLVVPIASHYIPVEFGEYLNLKVEAFLEERVYGRRF